MMQWFNSLPRKRLIALILGIIIAGVGMYLVLRDDAPVDDAQAVLPSVVLTTSSQLASESTISLVGSVRAFTEAAVTAERGGRVTSVRVALGDTAQAGQVLVTLENAAESAAVLQAEGAYDAAVAAAAQSNIGPEEAASNLKSANNNAIALIKTVYSTTDNVIRNNIDQFFSNPEAVIPGLKLDGKGNTARLNEMRVAYQQSLPAMKARGESLTNSSDVQAELSIAVGEVNQTISFVSLLISIIDEQDSNSRYTESELRNFSTTFNAVRNNLLSLQNQLENASVSIDSANDLVSRAQLGATGGTTSAADAQIKQALGALRAAQANYAKTVLRAPVTGTVNELPVRVGDFIAPQTKVAEVANNNALEIVTYASDAELFALQPGDVVMIEGAYEGVITTIAPAVDSATGKTEIRIATDNSEIKNGDTVRITTAITSEDVSEADVRVPLTAVKFEREDGFMFTVNDGRLVKFPVELGPVFGSDVTIAAGLSVTDSFVVDARGLREGDQVETAK